MKKLTAFLAATLLAWTFFVPSSQGRAPSRGIHGPRGGYHWSRGHHRPGFDWFLPGLIIGGVLGWTFSPYYRNYRPVYPPAYESPPAYYPPPPPPVYYPPAKEYDPPYDDYASSWNNPFESAPYIDREWYPPHSPVWVPGHCTYYSPRPGVWVEECYQGRWE